MFSFKRKSLLLRKTTTYQRAVGLATYRRGSIGNLIAE